MHIKDSQTIRRKGKEGAGGGGGGGSVPLVKPRNQFWIVPRKSQYPRKSKMERYKMSRRESEYLFPIMDILKVKFNAFFDNALLNKI